jgi:signal peptidase I
MENKNVKQSVLEFVKTVGVALLIALLIRDVIAAPYKIPSGSMIPTLLVGDYIFVSKFSYNIRIPFTSIELVKTWNVKRGDIVVFKEPLEQKLDYIKRVVGLPGDKVKMVDKKLYVNSQKIKVEKINQHIKYENEDELPGGKELFIENLNGVKHIVQYSRLYFQNDFEEIKVPEDHLFVMGDNRDNSKDSRIIGFIPMKNVRGRAKIIWLSWDNENFKVRVDRLFKLLF